MSAASKLLDRLEGVCSNGPGKWQALCPAHADRNPSLSIDETETGDLLLLCRAGCPTTDVVARVGLTMSELFAEHASGNRGREIAATYDYVDEDGTLLFQAVRFEPKEFRQRRPNGDGWTWKLGDVRRVLYRLPAVLEAVRAGETVYLVEGEKDADALVRAGVTATCSPMGAGKWRGEYAASLAGASVVVVADKDEPGRQHAEQIATSLHGKAASVEIVEAAHGKDAYDHLGAGKTIDEFVELSGRANTSQQVETAELLDEIKAFITRFVVLPSDAAGDVLALWVLHTHAFDAFWATPYLRIVSATPEAARRC